MRRGMWGLEEAAQRVDRRHLLAGLAAAVAVTLIAAIPGVLTNSGGGDRRLRAAAAPAGDEGPPSGTVSAVPVDPGAPQPDAGSPTSQPKAQVLGVSFERTSTTSVTPVITPPARSDATTTTAPKPSCRNSSDPACGPFRWDPAPDADQPLHVEVTFSPATPKAGEQVTFTITASDPDDHPISVEQASYGQGEVSWHNDVPERMNPSLCPKQYGPWTPPDKNAGSSNSTDQHTFANAGTYDVSYGLHSGGFCNDPYASDGGGSVTVTVLPAAG